MTRDEKIRKYAAAIQRDIVSCSNEQSREDGEYIWIKGGRSDVSDLLMSHNVPEQLQEEVAARLRCPSCGNSLEIWEDVGIKYSFEQQHEATIERARSRHGKELFDFYDFVNKFPLLGATHPFGKKILREVQKSPRISLDKSQWFRAKESKNHGFGPAPPKFVSDQRYNSSGQSHWYFSDKPEAAVAEVTSGRTAWVQRFHVGHVEGLLDLRPWRAEDDRVLDDEGDYYPPHGLLIAALIYGDLLTQRNDEEGEDRQWKPEYLVTRFLAEAASVSGFTGILCVSVRYPAENLVVFDPKWWPRPVEEPAAFILDENAMQLREAFGWNQGEPLILGPPIIGPELV